MVNCSNERIGTVYGGAFDREVSEKTHYFSPPLERKCFGDKGRGSTESSGYSLQNGSRKQVRYLSIKPVTIISMKRLGYGVI